MLQGRASMADDPRWRDHGAASREEYARWADHLCGMACVQMVLGALGRPVPDIHVLRREIQVCGGYVEQQDGSIKGLIYSGAVAWLAQQGIAARIILDEPADAIPAKIDQGALYIASVHARIRHPDMDPPSTGGHLVLVFGQDRLGRLRFHNPSGHTAASRRDVRLSPEAFSRFHADRGILIPL